VIFKNIFAEKFSENIGVFLLNLLLVFAKIVIITSVFVKNAIFRRKLAKIAENCDHNIDPRSPCYIGQSLVKYLITLKVVLKGSNEIFHREGQCYSTFYSDFYHVLVLKNLAEKFSAEMQL
jgi:hypothetical protein